jgi:SAM-dependent methyltransferase
MPLGVIHCPACAGPPRPWRPEVSVCRRCGSSFRELTREAFDPQSHYAGYYEGAPELSALTAARLEAWAKALLPYRRLGRVLEVGCGKGHFLAAAQAAGFEAWGTEVSSSGLQALRERGLQVLPGELPELSLPAEHFDAVILFEVIEHLPDPTRYLTECHRVVREGGALLITTPNFDSLSRRILGERWRVVDPEHLVLFTSRGLRMAFERAGFCVRALSSRNLEPTEILRGLRGGPRRPTEQRQAKVDACRAALEARPALRALKNVANGVLGRLGAGDTLEAMAER